MIDQLMILAEGGAQAAEGIPAPLIGVGVFVILLSLLGVTFLTSGGNQPKKPTKPSASNDR